MFITTGDVTFPTFRALVKVSRLFEFIQSHQRILDIKKNNSFNFSNIKSVRVKDFEWNTLYEDCAELNQKAVNSIMKNCNKYYALQSVRQIESVKDNKTEYRIAPDDRIRDCFIDVSLYITVETKKNIRDTEYSSYDVSALCYSTAFN